MTTTFIHENRPAIVEPPRDSRALGWAASAWIAFGIALTVKTAVEPIKHSVYPCFELAAQGWLADENIYELLRGYRYSPAFAMSFNAFSAWPPRVGGILWNLVNLAALFAALRLLARDVLPRDWGDRGRAVFLALALVGSARGLWAAQTTSLCFAFAAFAAWGIVQKRWWLAAACLAVPIYVKVWPLAFALLALACWPRQLTGRFALCALLPAAAPFLSRPPHIVLWQYANWFEFLTGPCQGRVPAYRDFWTILEALRISMTPQAYLVLQLATAGGVAAWCLGRRWMGETDRGLLAFMLALWTAWQLLLGPGTERNTYGLAAPMLAWAVVASFREQRLRWTAATAWGLNLLLAGTGTFERWIAPAIDHAEAITPMSALALVVWLAFRPRDRGTPQVVERGFIDDHAETRIWRRDGESSHSTAAA